MIEHFVEDCCRMLNDKELHNHTRRGWLYKALEDYTKHIEATGEPGKHLFWSRRWHTEKERGVRSTRREHSYPLGCITDEFAPEGQPWKPVVKSALLHRFQELVLCYITEEEDDSLNATVVNGVFLKTRMPPGSSCRFARYHASKLPIVPTRTPPDGWRPPRKHVAVAAASEAETGMKLEPACTCCPDE